MNCVKFYDDKNYIVGVLFGELSKVGMTIGLSQARELQAMFENMSNEVGHIVHIRDANDGFNTFSYEYTEIPKSELTDEQLKELMQEEIMNSVQIAQRPIFEKKGFKAEPVVNGNIIAWEIVPDPAYVATSDGSYLNPIPYEQNIEVEIGKWYTDGNDIWECIENGVPMSFDDKNYFDIID